MNYLDALQMAHEILQPDLYFEIGCRRGISLALSRCPAVAVDPDFDISAALMAPTRLFKQTSDDFFARPDVSSVLGQPIDLAFIDGMHLVEYALRDFANIEKVSSRSTVILIDDVLPTKIEWATRERKGQYWTGDIYRLIPILRTYRPDLRVRVYDIEEKGIAVVSNLSPENCVLRESMPEIGKQIDSGGWICTNTREIQELLDPRASSLLGSDLRSIKPQATGNSSHSDPDLSANLYLELVKKSVLNEIYLENELRISYLRECLDGVKAYDYLSLINIAHALPAEFKELKRSRGVGQFPDRQIGKSGFSHTMMGRKRLDSLNECLDLVVENDVQGDLVECGVWRGGGCILMAAYLKAHAISDRRVFVADSFEGLPVPTHPKDKNLDLSKERFPELSISLETVKDNFRRYDLLGQNVIFLQGWFKDTLANAPIEQIALLRIDGDLYESTIDCLKAFYDRVPHGGVIIVDDWGALSQCRQAVTDFFSLRDEKLPDVTEIDWTGVYWVKN
ncbi:MAG: TylF/MycF/NovP-related O-methyltransferase [Rhizobiaceae bacterium]